MKISKEIVADQILECISEIHRYSTVWNGKRVIIIPITYRKIISITVDNKTAVFDYADSENASKYILDNLLTK